MSMRYKGATLSSTAPVTTGGESGTAPGAWTLEQQAQAQAAGLWPIPPLPKYIEDVFSTYLYTGTGSAQTITNGIDLSTKGGMTWIKQRNGTYNQNHSLTDTARGAGYFVSSDTTSAQQNSSTQAVSAFTTSGFSLTGNDNQVNGTYPSPISYVSWTFRKQPKFFDIVTYTGDGTSKFINHNLGSQPGFVVVKATDGSSDWNCRHIGIGSSGIKLNSTDASLALFAAYNTDVTSTQFKVWNTSATYDSWNTNRNGVTYVAYLFAHDAGGFGLSGTDNVISCGSFTTDGSGNATVSLGYEPQWFLEKNSSSAGDNWNAIDTMRGMSLTGAKYLFPNLSNAEANVGLGAAIPTATGLDIRYHTASTTYIYIAIRRGPMKVPTDATKVFKPTVRSGTGAVASTTGVGFPPSLLISAGDGWGRGWFDRLRGPLRTIESNVTAAEVSSTGSVTSYNMDGVSFGADGDHATVNYSGNYSQYYFQRAPSFFDEVCYTGTGSATTVAHNLGAVPELVINKNRDGTFGWYTCFNFTSTTYDQNTLSTINAANIAVTYGTGGDLFSAKPTTTGLPLSAGANNLSAKTYVSYLFATCAGVSKVGSYTGTGAAQTINCGFTAGARFVLIKRTDSTGDWYVWDSARGIVAGNDPHLSLNSTAAEVTTDDSVDTDSTGFVVNQVAATNINVSSATYIFLAVA